MKWNFPADRSKTCCVLDPWLWCGSVTDGNILLPSVIAGQPTVCMGTVHGWLSSEKHCHQRGADNMADSRMISSPSYTGWEQLSPQLGKLPV